MKKTCIIFLGGPFTLKAGTLSYYEICIRISEGGKKMWDDQSSQPYVYLNDEWFSLDDTKSLKIKVNKNIPYCLD